MEPAGRRGPPVNSPTGREERHPGTDAPSPPPGPGARWALCCLRVPGGGLSATVCDVIGGLVVSVPRLPRLHTVKTELPLQVSSSQPGPGQSAPGVQMSAGIPTAEGAGPSVGVGGSLSVGRLWNTHTSHTNLFITHIISPSLSRALCKQRYIPTPP